MSGMKSILVVGSANLDMIVKSQALPRPRETIIGGAFSMVPGGKGANQAVAAARLGGNVAFMTCLGDDDFGRSLLSGYRQEGIDTRFIQTIENTHTGVAFILVDSYGENMISVASGANAHFTADRLEALKTGLTAEGGGPSSWAEGGGPGVPDWVLLQLEIPLPTVAAAVEWAKAAEARVILDPAPAPAGGLPDSIINHVDILTPNEVEASALVNREVRTAEEAFSAGEELSRRGVGQVIVTLGDRGGVCVSQSDRWAYPTRAVEAVDSTAAGDCFAGALAVGLSEGLPVREAVESAAQAAALSVTRMGAQSSLPFRDELTESAGTPGPGARI